ncbi:hypothetical protein KTO58_18995 [Chitinophaga pendula]|uniref:hypothetical protein n=1 Tax=Chitinophaga TaxID=79328 RepID=UPI000BB0A41E|nr:MULTISPECIES: hypothetical protein [Chitinophaga]ASZ11241.1 hypothetical protein CK934_09820 [Chitinophaga sp. MD30]UCJ05762.1 hypothetical protein KTO58_18995 [Chitinophaga pendula]
MNRKYIKTLMLLSLATGAMAQQKSSNLHIGFVYPISSNGSAAAQYTNKTSLHLLSGLSYAEKGFAGSGIATIVKDSVRGTAISGITNLVGNHAKGVLLAGIYNGVRNDMKGAQIAGVANASKTMEGIQMAGITNLADSTNGTQLSGIFNSAPKGEAGLQIAGIANYASQVHVQIGGILNRAKKVKGVQIGLINIADSSEYSIGLINIVKNGEKSIGLSIDETATGLVTFRSGGRRLYGIFGAGYNFKSKQTLYAFEAGVGYRLPVAGGFRMNFEIANIVLEDFKKGSYNKAAGRIYAAYRFGKRFEIYAGPTFNYLFITDDLGKDLVSNYIRTKMRNGHFEGTYIGASGGVQFVF